jgi:arabinose-5-phosphate isomerase
MTAVESHVLGPDQILDAARNVVTAEIDALKQIVFDWSFVYAVRLLAGCEGRVLTTGIGKSGIVAQRIAATLTVTGTPAWYLHPSDAMHGDLGRVQRKDLLLVVSRSGSSSDELCNLVQRCKEWELPIILITSNPAALPVCDCILVHPAVEACRWGLTPTSTATAASVIGDALALVLQQLRGFGPEEFAAFHPRGTLGRRLTVRVQEVMVTGDSVGIIAPGESLLNAMILLAHKRGTLVVCADGQSVLGVITAGDVARYLGRRGAGWQEEPVATVMTSEPHITTPQMLASAVLQEMEDAGIMAMPVIECFDDTDIGAETKKTVDQLVGMIHLHDILRAGVA